MTILSMRSVVVVLGLAKTINQSTAHSPLFTVVAMAIFFVVHTTLFAVVKTILLVVSTEAPLLLTRAVLASQPREDDIPHFCAVVVHIGPSVPPVHGTGVTVGL